MSRKLRLAVASREYIQRHESELEQHLAQSSSTKDVLYRYFIMARRVVRTLVTPVKRFLTRLLPWVGVGGGGNPPIYYFSGWSWSSIVGIKVGFRTALSTMKEIIITFLSTERWGTGERKLMLPEDRISAYDFKVLWDFEGMLRYSPMFYGYYSKAKSTSAGYRVPLAYFLTATCVYAYSFVAILRKMAANNRMSKLADDDECTFTWKVLVGWDYTVGNLEAAQNKVAAIHTGFKEVLLEAQEAQKEEEGTSWKLTARRVLGHFLVFGMICLSAYAIVLLVKRSEGVDSDSSWWRQNELTLILALIGNAFPNFFDIVGLMEMYHPRKQLQWQLTRIMALNLLNLYTLIFALFNKVNDMSGELGIMKSNISSQYISMTTPSTMFLDSTVTDATTYTTSPDSSSSGLALDQFTTSAAATASHSTYHMYSENMDLATIAFSTLGVLSILKNLTESSLETKKDSDIMDLPTESYCQRISVPCETTTTMSMDIENNFTMKYETSEINSTFTAEHLFTTTTAEVSEINLYNNTDTDNETKAEVSEIDLYKDTDKDIETKAEVSEIDIYNETNTGIEAREDLPDNENSSSLIFPEYHFTDFYGSPHSAIYVDANESEELSTASTALSTSQTTQAAGLKISTSAANIQTTEATLSPEDISFNELMKLAPRIPGFHPSFLSGLDYNDFDYDPSDTVSPTERPRVKRENRNESFNSILKKENYTVFHLDNTTELNVSDIDIYSDINNNENFTILNMSEIADNITFTTPTLSENISSLHSTDEYSNLINHTEIVSYEITSSSTYSSTPFTPTSDSFEMLNESLLETTTTNLPSKIAFFNSSSKNSVTGECYVEVCEEGPVDVKSSSSGNGCSYGGGVTPPPLIISRWSWSSIDYSVLKIHSRQIGRIRVVGRSALYPPTRQAFGTALCISTTTVPHPEALVPLLPTQRRKRLRKLCWETMFGQEIIKLTVMDLIITVVTIVVGDYFRAVIVRLFNRCSCWDLEKKFPGYPDFKIAENILHLVNNQGLVWSENLLNPISVPAIKELIALNPVLSWAVVTSNVPPETVFKASDNNNFYLTLLLTMLFLCTLPVGYAVVWVDPSWHCGPFSDYPKIYQLFTHTLIGALPASFHPVIDYISSPGVVIPAGLLLVLIIYYQVALTGALREANRDLKEQLHQERSSEKRKALEANSGKPRSETPTTRWNRVLPLTPMPRSRLDGIGGSFSISDKNKLKECNDIEKAPLVNHLIERDDGTWPDDITEAGHSEVFDDSLSEPRKDSRDRTVENKNKRHDIKKDDSKRQGRDDKREEDKAEKIHEQLPRSPRSPRNRNIRNNSYPPNARDEYDVSPMGRNQDQKSYHSKDRKHSGDEHKNSPSHISYIEKPKKNQGVTAMKMQEKMPQSVISELSKVVIPKSPAKAKKRNSYDFPAVINENQDVSHTKENRSRHRRESSIPKIEEVRKNNQKEEKKNQVEDNSHDNLKHKRSSSEESQKMQTIPLIKISKEDSVERSLQQAKLERQSKTLEEQDPSDEEQDQEIPKSKENNNLDENPLYNTEDGEIQKHKNQRKKIDSSNKKQGRNAPLAKREDLELQDLNDSLQNEKYSDEDDSEKTDATLVVIPAGEPIPTETDLDDLKR
ncbi:unnamed protein product, partial [Meganyctiphanes norvegica]